MATNVKSHDEITDGIEEGQWVILHSGELAKIEAVNYYNDFIYTKLFIPARGCTEWMYHNHIAAIVDQDYCQQVQEGDIIRIANNQGLTEKAFVLHDLGGLVVIRLATGEVATAAKSLIVQRFALDELTQHHQLAEMAS